MKGTVTLSMDVFQLLMELASLEADNRAMDADEQDLWDEALQELE